MLLQTKVHSKRVLLSECGVRGVGQGTLGVGEREEQAIKEEEGGGGGGGLACGYGKGTTSNRVAMMGCRWWQSEWPPTPCR